MNNLNNIMRLPEIVISSNCVLTLSIRVIFVIHAKLTRNISSRVHEILKRTLGTTIHREYWWQHDSGI